MSQPSTTRVSAIASCYRGEKYLPAFLENCAEQTIAYETEILLVHNDPSDADRELVAAFAREHPGLVTHVTVEREPLAVSTNRALAMARGRYVCIWNIDDLRTPNSLECSARTLDEHPGAGFTYGAYVLVDEWRKTEGPIVRPPDFDRRAFVRSMHLGPFYMWRRSLSEQIGYWDEQLKMGADFDYAIRLSLAAEGRRTDALLGYYLDEGLGLSTASTSVQPIERTVLERRYGAFDKINLAAWRPASEYRLDEVLHGDRWIPLDQVAPDRERFARHRAWLLFAALRSPLRYRTGLARRFAVLARQLPRRIGRLRR
jgi:glycosyltransferase involved in cell wall biosynthesis